MTPTKWIWPGAEAHGKPSFDVSECHEPLGSRVVELVLRDVDGSSRRKS